MVGVVEITIPWDGRVEAARAEKRQTYSPLVEALSGKFLNENQIIIISLPNYSDNDTCTLTILLILLFVSYSKNQNTSTLHIY